MNKCRRDYCNGDLELKYEPIIGWVEECMLCNRQSPVKVKLPPPHYVDFPSSASPMAVKLKPSKSTRVNYYE